MTDRKKPGWAFWTTVVLAVVLAYPLSFGPACWLAHQTFAPQLRQMVNAHYAVVWPKFRRNAPKPMVRAATWYLDLWHD